MTSWQPSPAGPSTTSASRREPPLELAPVASTAWGAESGSGQRKPSVEKVKFETLPIVDYTPPAVKPTLEEVRAELAARPFEPSRAVAEYLELNVRTPVSMEQMEKLPRDVKKHITGSEHLLLTTENASVWYAAPISKDVKQADGTRKHVKTCEVIRDVVPNDPRLPDWMRNGVGITDQDTRLQSKCARICNAMKRNLSHPITRQFLKRLGHQTRKTPPVGGTWEEYDKQRKLVIPHALTPVFNNLKTIATVLNIWREKTRSSTPGEPGIWGSPSNPGIVNKMRVTDRR